MLDHIRHLLVQAPELQALGLQGGLSTWLMQNVEEMEVQARYAYAGQTDPSTAQVQEGATWIYDNMQRLASIDVTSYPPQ